MNAPKNHEHESDLESTIQDRRKEKMDRRFASVKTKVSKETEVRGISSEKERKRTKKSRAIKNAKVSGPTRNQSSDITTTSTYQHRYQSPQVQDDYDDSYTFANHGTLYPTGNDAPISDPKLSRLQSFPSFSIAPERCYHNSNNGLGTSQYNYRRSGSNKVQLNSSDIPHSPKSTHRNEQSVHSSKNTDSQFIPEYFVAPEEAYYKFGHHNYSGQYEFESSNTKTLERASATGTVFHSESQVVPGSTNCSEAGVSPYLSQDPDLTTSAELNNSHTHDKQPQSHVRDSRHSVRYDNGTNNHHSDKTIDGQHPVQGSITLGSPFSFSLGINNNASDYETLSGQFPSTVEVATTSSSLPTWGTLADSNTNNESELDSVLFQMEEFESLPALDQLRFGFK